MGAGRCREVEQKINIRQSSYFEMVHRREATSCFTLGIFCDNAVLNPSFNLYSYRLKV